MKTIVRQSIRCIIRDMLNEIKTPGNFEFPGVFFIKNSDKPAIIDDHRGLLVCAVMFRISRCESRNNSSIIILCNFLHL